MAYVDVYDAATDPAAALRKQVAVAVIRAAADVRNEAASTPNHARRLAWADLVVSEGPGAWAERMVWRVLENGTIAASPATATDGDVQFVVNGLVDYFAGA